MGLVTVGQIRYKASKSVLFTNDHSIGKIQFNFSFKYLLLQSHPYNKGIIFILVSSRSTFIISKAALKERTIVDKVNTLLSRMKNCHICIR